MSQSVRTHNHNITNSLSDNNTIPTELFSYVYNHPQSESKKVITNVKWDIIPDISCPEIATHYAKIIFQPSIYWKNKEYSFTKLFR